MCKEIFIASAKTKRSHIALYSHKAEGGSAVYTLYEIYGKGCAQWDYDDVHEALNAFNAEKKRFCEEDEAC